MNLYPNRRSARAHGIPVPVLDGPSFEEKLWTTASELLPRLASYTASARFLPLVDGKFDLSKATTLQLHPGDVPLVILVDGMDGLATHPETAWEVHRFDSTPEAEAYFAQVLAEYDIDPQWQRVGVPCRRQASASPAAEACS